MGTLAIHDDSTTQAESRTVEGKARQRFSPNSLLELVISEEKSTMEVMKSFFDVDEPKRITLTLDTGSAFDLFCVSPGSEKSVYTPSRVPVRVNSKSKTIAKAVFHLFNLPDLHGSENYVLLTGETPHQGARSCGCLTLKFDGWFVTVAGNGNTHKVVKSLKQTGGYVITHVGEIKREDCTDFSSQDLESVLEFLTYLFAFSFGRWSSPCLTVGFDVDENRVDEERGLRRCEAGAWNGGKSWFDANHAELIFDLLPGFWCLWSDETWKRSLKDAIYWYTEANRAGAGIGVDSALLFTQAALELLSWTSCVLDRGMVSPKAFSPNKLSASDKLRLLVSSLNIPLAIPLSLKSLHSKAGSKWEDSMHAITDLRNSLVHPGKEKKVPEGAYYDAWRLSMWYIELLLLRLCTYSGKYANRLSQRFAGQVESVP